MTRIGQEFYNLSTLYAPYSTGSFVYTNFMTNVFVPWQLSSCINYMSADYGVSVVNGTVTQWTDQSSYHSDFTQTNSLYQPTMTNSTIFFDGNNSTLSNPISLTNATLASITNCYDLTLCAVCTLNQKQTTTKGVTTFLKFGTNLGTVITINVINSAGALIQMGTCLGLIGINSGRTMYIGFDITPNTPFIFSMTLSLTTSMYITPVVYINGQSNPYNLAPLDTTYRNHIDFSLIQISSNTNMNNCLCGSVSSLALYNTVLSTIQRQQLEGYLAYKYWGNGAVLGTSHPYYNTSPNDISTLFNSKTFN